MPRPPATRNGALPHPSQGGLWLGGSSSARTGLVFVSIIRSSRAQTLSACVRSLVCTGGTLSLRSCESRRDTVPTTLVGEGSEGDGGEGGLEGGGSPGGRRTRFAFGVAVACDDGEVSAADDDVLARSAARFGARSASICSCRGGSCEGSDGAGGGGGAGGATSTDGSGGGGGAGRASWLW